MEEKINQRIAWIEQRVELSELAKEYIAFQMMQFAKYYHKQQVEKCDLADVVGQSEQLGCKFCGADKGLKHGYMPDGEPCPMDLTA